MLEYGKYKGSESNHRAIAREIYDFFKADPERIAYGNFAQTKDGYSCNVDAELVYSLCIRGARFRLIGMEPVSAYVESDPIEKNFANYLGYDNPNDLAHINNNAPLTMMENLKIILKAA